MKIGFKSWVLVIFLAIITAGCATSPPARFYTLNGIDKPEHAPPTTTGKEETIGVGPVSIPAYLDRPQIVTLSGKTRSPSRNLTVGPAHIGMKSPG